MTNVFVIFVLFWNLSGTAVAAPEKVQVMKLLEGRHWDLDAEAFQRMGKGTDDVLIKIAGDTSLINYLRFRALQALSLFPTENAATFLERTANKSFTPLAHRGFEALKQGFAKTHPQRVKRLAVRLLNHSNAQVRISAARVIRSMDEPRFKSFLKTEQNAWVRKEAQK